MYNSITIITSKISNLSKEESEEWEGSASCCIVRAQPILSLRSARRFGGDMTRERFEDKGNEVEDSPMKRRRMIMKRRMKRRGNLATPQPRALPARMAAVASVCLAKQQS